MTRRLLLLALLLSPAQAAPPVGADPNSAAATWFKSLRTPKGYSCCDESDCRPTAVELRQDGVWAWIGREVYGDDAPDEWRPIPAALLEQMHPPRPPGVRGAVVCFYRGAVLCADLEGGS